MKNLMLDLRMLLNWLLWGIGCIDIFKGLFFCCFFFEVVFMYFVMCFMDALFMDLVQSLTSLSIKTNKNTNKKNKKTKKQKTKTKTEKKEQEESLS